MQGSVFSERTYPNLSFMKEEKLAEVLAGLNDTYQEAIGHQRHKMIKSCLFAGFDCYYQ